MNEWLYNRLTWERIVELVREVLLTTGQVSNVQVKNIAMDYSGIELTDEDAQDILREAANLE